MRGFGLGLGFSRPGPRTPSAPAYLPTVSASPSGVYGTTNLVQSYSGPCCLVTRASDNTTQDIGFVNGRIDMTSALAFAAGSELTVRVWYDQSGNANDLTQTTVANQPRLRPQNAWRGLQGFTFDGFRAASGGTLIAKTFNVPSTITTDRRATTGFTVNGLKASYSPNATLELGTTTTRILPFASAGNTGNSVLLGSSAVPGSVMGTRWSRHNPSVNGWRGSDSLSNIYTDTTSESFSAFTAGSATGGRIGATASGAQFNHRGEFYGLVIYPAALSDDDVALVSAALQSAYGIDYSQSALVLVEGDSISEGTGDTFMMNAIRQAYPSFSRDVHLYNMAVHGTTAAIEYGRRAAKFAGVDRAEATTKILVLGLGSNDLSAGVTAANLWWNSVLPYIQWAQGQGYSVIVSTIIPRGTFTAGQETERLSFNQDVRNNASTYSYDVADHCALPEFDSQADASNTTYYYTDAIHPVSAGYTLMAGVIAPLVNARL